MSAKRNPMDMDPMEIRSNLVRRGITQKSIAKSLNVSVTTVSLVIDGRTVSDRVRRAIANAIGMDIKSVWRSISEDGPRRPGRPSKR